MAINKISFMLYTNNLVELVKAILFILSKRSVVLFNKIIINMFIYIYFLFLKISVFLL